MPPLIRLLEQEISYEVAEYLAARKRARRSIRPSKRRYHEGVADTARCHSSRLDVIRRLVVYGVLA